MTTEGETLRYDSAEAARRGLKEKLPNVFRHGYLSPLNPTTVYTVSDFTFISFFALYVTCHMVILRGKGKEKNPHHGFFVFCFFFLIPEPYQGFISFFYGLWKLLIVLFIEVGGKNLRLYVFVLFFCFSFSFFLIEC